MADYPYTMFPYAGLPAYKNWRTAVASLPYGEIDPQVGGRFSIDRATKIASAGSCFAKRIAESLCEYGFSYHVAEPAPSWLTAEQRAAFNYGVFSARYGNIYTALQLVQLLERAMGRFTPVSDVWMGKDGSFLDPFRPTIQPGGFSSAAELKADRTAHLGAVRSMFRDIDLFVFTLGLTEGFCDARDGAAFPVCPGRDMGEFDPAIHVFRNLGIAENLEYLHRAIALMRELNPNLKIVFTVSPVPLAATLEERHVIASTVYSKSVLRVAADEMRRSYDFVDYFASFEIVTATFNNREYFQDDRRNVKPEGVDHVMRSFYKHYAGLEIETMTKAPKAEDPIFSLEVKPCDEEELLRYINADLGERSA